MSCSGEFLGRQQQGCSAKDEEALTSGERDEGHSRRADASGIAASSLCVLMAQTTRGVTIFFTREGKFITLTPCSLPVHLREVKSRLAVVRQKGQL